MHVPRAFAIFVSWDTDANDYIVAMLQARDMRAKGRQAGLRACRQQVLWRSGFQAAQPVRPVLVHGQEEGGRTQYVVLCLAVMLSWLLCCVVNMLLPLAGL